VVVAALDIGLKRIGVALSLDGKMALPQPAILRKNRHQAASEVDAFLQAWRVETLVVGIPKGGGSEEEMARRVRAAGVSDRVTVLNRQVDVNRVLADNVAGRLIRGPRPAPHHQDHTDQQGGKGHKVVTEFTPEQQGKHGPEQGKKDNLVTGHGRGSFGFVH